MDDSKRKTLLKLARDVTRETLHGPVPMATVAELAMGVLQLETDLAAERALADRLAEGLCEDDDALVTCHACGEVWDDASRDDDEGHGPDCPVAEHAAKRARGKKTR